MKKKHRKILYPTIFISGLLLMAWQVVIFRNTIIDYSILIGIILIVGVLTFLLDFKNYGKTYNYSGIGLYFYSLMHYFFGYGFIVCSIFMLTNFYLADKNPIKKTFEIVERSSLPGSKHHRDERKPTFRINYKGKEKELVFQHKYFGKMESYKSVELAVRKGYFGFDILENKKLN
tara:strand:- start:5886 stop:6410 length:525 start_codon:yes stop_codon:yes gene_type:complete